MKVMGNHVEKQGATFLFINEGQMSVTVVFGRSYFSFS